MIDYLTPRKAAVAGAAALLLVLLVGWFLFVSPQRSEAAKLDNDIGDARTKLALAQALIRGSEARRGDVARLTAAMPSEVRMSSILRELSATAAKANVRINSIAPQAATPVGTYFTIPLSVSLEGRYFNIARFLRLLHGRTVVVGDKVAGKGRLYSVPQIQLSSGGEAGLLQGTMTVDAYTYNGAAPAPTPTPETTTSSSSAAAVEPSP